MRAGLLFSAIVLTLTAVASADGGLTPDQILIVVGRSDSIGPVIARLYCEKRNVPRENVVAIDAPAGEVISWSAYQAKIVEPLRQHLKKKNQAQSIHCLLLVGNLPLRMEPDPATKDELAEVKELGDDFAKLTLKVYQNAWRVEQLGELKSPGVPPEKLEGNVKNVWEAREYYWRVMHPAFDAIANAPADRGKQLANELAEIRRKMEGYPGQVDPEPADRNSPKFAEWQKKYAAVVQPQLDKALGDTNDKRLLTLAKRQERLHKVLDARGLLGLIDEIVSQQNELNSRGRVSAMDSELALLWWDDYKLDGAFRNELFNCPDWPAKKNPATLMVARLDGSDATQPKRMIEDSISVEKAGQGISGKVCVDAQGLSSNDPNHWQDDRILQLAEWKQRPAGMPLAKETSLMAIAPADANPIGFFAGWSPGQTCPSGYKCARGAVTIICNPSGAAELHDPKGRQWCNAFLEAGAAAVVGGVEDVGPGTSFDFPRFAQALLVDSKTLAEAYWYACGNTSWRYILIGDPLYRPCPAAAAKPAQKP